jgi:hypothetical protein
MLDDGDDQGGEIEAPEPEPAVTAIDPRTLPVRFSRLKHMARSPLHYWQSCQFSTDDSLARRLGTGAHALVFDQPHAVYTGKVRRGKAWDAFKEANDGMPIMNETEFRRARAIADAILRHPFARHVMFDDEPRIEQEIEWEFLGRRCSSRPDSISPLRLVDLKSTQSSHPDEFPRQAWRMLYPAQASFYTEAAKVLGWAPERKFLVAVEQKLPHAVTVFRLTEEAMDAGERCWRGWFETLLVCESSNHWPEYTSMTVDLDVPAEDRAFDLVMPDGQTVTF